MNRNLDPHVADLECRLDAIEEIVRAIDEALGELWSGTEAKQKIDKVRELAAKIRGEGAITEQEKSSEAD